MTQMLSDWINDSRFLGGEMHNNQFEYQDFGELYNMVLGIW